MKLTSISPILFSVGILLPMTSVHADQDMTRTPENFVNATTISSEIESQLAADYPNAIDDIKVVADDHGTVQLSGEADTKREMREVVSIARQTDGVKEVKNDIIVK